LGDPGDQPGATALDGPALVTAMGSAIGTPCYMAPEQAAGMRVDERADVYALGALIYHVLAGVPPYASDASADVVAQVLHGPGRRSPRSPPRRRRISSRSSTRRWRARPRTAMPAPLAWPPICASSPPAAWSRRARTRCAPC